MEKSTVVEYMYRDASNYKIRFEIRLAGVFSSEDLEMIRLCMYDGEYFIPQEVGLPPLQPLLWNEYGSPNNDDHDWHTIERIRLAAQKDTAIPIFGTTDEILAKFHNIKIKQCQKHAQC